MTTLNSITPQNEIEAALDDALRIYIESWAKGDYFFSTSDSSYLYDLAGRNPRYYGSAVEIARVMMNLDQVDYYDSPGARFGRPLADGAVKTMTESIDLFDVIPNPNTGKMIFRCKAGVAKGILRIFDGIGNVISRFVISSEDSDVELFSARPGMYFYSFTGDDQTVARGKFVIQR